MNHRRFNVCTLEWGSSKESDQLSGRDNNWRRSLFIVKLSSYNTKLSVIVVHSIRFTERHMRRCNYEYLLVRSFLEDGKNLGSNVVVTIHRN